MLKENFKTIHITPASISLEVLLKNRLKILESAGFEIIGMSTDDEYGIRFKNSGFSFIASKYLTRKFDIINDIKFFIESYRNFRKLKPSIVNTYGPKPGLYARIAARLAGVPVVVHTSWGLFFAEDSPWYKKIPIIIFEKIAALFCDYIFSVNKDDLKLMVKYKFKRKKNLGYLGNGTDLNKFNPSKIKQEQVLKLKKQLGFKRDSIIIGTVARLTVSKGYRDLFYVAQFIKKKHKNTEFLIIGPTDFTKGDGITLDEIKYLENKSIIKYLGPKKHDDMPLLYAVMDIVVLPSYREGFPRSLVEAAAMGKPLVATNIRGCREAIDNGVNGFLVPLKNWKALADVIEQLILNKELRKKMGNESRRKALREFDENKLVKRIISIYKRLIQEKLFIL